MKTTRTVLKNKSSTRLPAASVGVPQCRFLRMLFMVGLAGLSSARADISLPSQPPPQPIAQSVTVYEGESVDIPLRGLTRTGLQVRFLVRSKPSLGTLSAVRDLDRSNALVTYTHVPARGVGLDAFRYAVQVPNSGVSTPAEVTISVVERLPVFEAPARLTFPDVEIGGSAVKVLELGNSGGGLIKGKVIAPEPWTFPTGDGSYSLKPGETTRIAVRFEPSMSQNYEGGARYSHDPVRELGLSGRGFTPIETAPTRLELRPDGDSEVRSGILTVRNVTDAERGLTIKAPPEVVVQNSVTVEAKSESEVAVHTRAGFLGALDTQIELRGDSFEMVVPMTVYASPARLVADSVEVFDLGTPTAGETVLRKVVLRNVGGSPAKVAAVVPGAVTVTPEPTMETIPPGGRQEYELAFARTLPGPVDEEIIFRGGSEPVRIAITGEVISVLPSGSGRAAQSGAKGETIRKFNSILPVEQVGVSRLTKTEMDLVWDLPAGEVASFNLYQRKITFGKDAVARSVWRPVTDVQIEIGEKVVRAFLTNLHAGEQVALSIVAVDADREESLPSLPFDLATRPPTPWRIPWPLVWILFFGGCVYVIVRERRRVRKQREMDHAEAELRMRL